MNTKDLQKFLIAANKSGYASGEDRKWIKEKDGSTTIPFQSGDWKMHDNFFGGEPYGGRLVVSHKNKPVWIMVYYGWVKEGVETDSVYKVLRSALAKMPDEAPFRGPKEYKDSTFIYKNTWQGNVEKYSGEEKISQSGKLIYKANYLGGLIDQRQGV